MAGKEDNKDPQEDHSQHDEGAENEGGATGLSMKKKMLMIAVPIVVVLLLVIGVYFSGLLDGLFSEKEPVPVASEVVAEGQVAADGSVVPAPTTPPVAVFYDLPEMLVNLNAGTKRQVYLKVQVSLDLPDDTTKRAVEAVIPRVIDSFQVYLRELTIEEVQGSAGMYRLKEELVDRINRVISPAKINDVLFKEMLIQ